MSLATLDEKLEFTREGSIPQQLELNPCLCAIDFRFQLENAAELVTKTIRQLTDQIAGLRSFSEDDLTRIGVALHEALSNAIHHGNLELDSELRQEDESLYYELADSRRLMWPFCDRQVHFLASLSRERVKFVIRDEGPGFDHRRVADPTDEENLSRIGGRGLLLIRSFMDEIKYNDRGNQITMVKYANAGHSLLARLERPSDLSASDEVMLFDFVDA